MDYQEIKRKIKNCRDTLVGIVPSPEAQVQQITIALMYKFMDDMDKREQEENDAPPMFFTGEFAKYSWTKLLAPQVGSQERMNLYAEAIEKMNENKGIPQLFRDVFRGAFLPYRNPETLSMFLKEINGFTYDNSENLGNAFEHLLSIMGSQGDAGMFRTPRHIIDFIVDAVDPQKNEQICDPACGSAGFLISAYNHIIKTNTKDKKGDLLSPEEKKKLIKNFVGYDISPDMVRLSKVNLYLHGFSSPTIFEYDTLSSEEKWDENFDVMLANPPFMSPRGGIRPHKRFSVQANRSEVLFVDYILEHLRPNGRAGIIVPEGIIFQSATAYKALRKLLIEDGLLAVVSLPAGVFNPYAGVKTSILLFDNGLAKKTKDILFLKIQNDGYDLGAQRREHNKNDLPLALEIIKKYRVALKENKKFGLNAEQAKISHLVAKDKIAESGDYNFSGDRYKEIINFTNQKWPMVELSEVADFIGGYAFKSNKLLKQQIENSLPVVKIGNLNKYGSINTDFEYYKFSDELNRYLIKKSDILIAMTGATVGKVAVSNNDNLLLNQRVGLIRAKRNIMQEFIKWLLLGDSFYKYSQQTAGGGAQGNISPTQILKYKIPCPPIEVQKEIVEQIEVKQKAIEAAKAVIENLERERCYFGQSLKKIKNVKWIELSGVADFFEDGNWIESKDQSEIGIRLIQTGNIGMGKYLDKAGKSRFISENTLKRLKCIEIFEGDILISRLPDPVGRGCLLPKLETRTITAVDCTIIRFNKKKIIPKFFLAYSMSDDYFSSLTQYLTGASRRRISRFNLGKIKIPILPIEIQKQLVAEMEEQEEIIEANKKLVGIMEQKITEVLSEI